MKEEKNRGLCKRETDCLASLTGYKEVREEGKRKEEKGGRLSEWCAYSLRRVRREQDEERRE